MSGMLGWMSDALGLNEEEIQNTRTADQEVEHIDGADFEEETEMIPDGMISKEHLYDIFSSFKALVTSEEGKKRLADAVKERKQVEDVTNLMQQEIATGLGLEGKQATDMFKYVLKTYKDDEVLCEEFIKFCESESLACDEAELGPVKLKEKIAALEKQEADKQKIKEGDAMKKKFGGSGGGMMRQLEMLQSTPEEFGKIMDGLEANMRKMMSKNPQVATQMIQQLEASGIKMEKGSDPIAASLKQVKDAHAAMKESIDKEAETKGVPFDQVVNEKMQRLQQLQQQRQNLPPVNTSYLRFKKGDKVECRITPEGQYAVGEIVNTGVDSGNGQIVPYQIGLLGGQEVFAPGDSDFFVRRVGSKSQAKSDEMPSARPRPTGARDDGNVISAQPGNESSQPPPQQSSGPQLRFKVGQQVACRVTPEGKYALGTVQQLNIAQPHGRMPYQVLLDDGNIIVAPIDNDFMIRLPGSTSQDATVQGVSQQPVPAMRQKVPKPTGPLRFSVGARVECRITPDGQYAPGTITKLNHSESHFPPGTVVPYQIQLDNGMLIFAPQDIDMMIRSAQ